MNNLDFVKKIDDLGRIVIPKEIRRILKIDKNDTMVINICDDSVILKKYNNLNIDNKKITLIGILLNKITNKNILITNRDEVLYSNKDIVNKEISDDLRKRIVNNYNMNNEYDLDICYDIKIKSFYYSKPILIDSNISGIVIIYSEKKIEEKEKEIIDIVSEMLSR